MVDIVNAVFVGPKGILLARRSPHKKAYPDLWSFPGGHVEADETLEEALIREIAEELNTTPQRFEFLMQIDDPTKSVSFHIHIVSSWDREPEIANNEHTELKWLSIEDARGLHDLALQE
ncbi:8-oxo-dGTP diphosphatase [Ochrobactrum sp. 19YEA23]|uniref:NUDIX domain-containing protein n=1 Tax=Ochrobactrum sp. 19YEA23 TaxID=3039854 RepID=UPI0024788368|nr:8-oxo-dGTP diphosphatase [Ochrobactrum sp. 19YEA23]